MKQRQTVGQKVRRSRQTDGQTDNSIQMFIYFWKSIAATAAS